MTLLGYRNPARRIVGAVRGLVRRPRESSKRRPVAVVGHRGRRGGRRRTLSTLSRRRSTSARTRSRPTSASPATDTTRRLWPDLRDELGRVLAARDAGRIESVIVWTVNDEERLRELVGYDVDGILTDDARRLRRIVSKRSPPA